VAAKAIKIIKVKAFKAAPLTVSGKNVNSGISGFKNKTM
jgi:hypothetical protein